MSNRRRRQFQSLYDGLHPAGCERCWRYGEPWLVPSGLIAVWVPAVDGYPMWERVV